jgi:hypothetical protein
VARAAFVGYKIPNLERPIKVGLYMSKITFFTVNFGVKATIQLN